MPHTNKEQAKVDIYYYNTFQCLPLSLTDLYNHVILIGNRLLYSLKGMFRSDVHY